MPSTDDGGFVLDCGQRARYSGPVPTPMSEPDKLGGLDDERAARGLARRAGSCRTAEERELLFHMNRLHHEEGLPPLTPQEEHLSIAQAHELGELDEPSDEFLFPACSVQQPLRPNQRAWRS